jgi:hypothetical protein
MTKPDWGHGPNPPVLMFTEDEIKTAWTECPCGSAYEAEPPTLGQKTVPLTAEQLIAGLKQGRIP